MDICRLSKIDPSKMFSITAYANKTGLTKGRISQKVKTGELKVVKYNGGHLVYDP